jgi:hypothetical protein
VGTYCGGVTIYDFLSIPTALDEVKIIEIEAYPNPSSGMMECQVPHELSGKEVTFQLFSSRGQLLWEDTFSNDKHYHYLDFLKFSSGLYLLFISDGNRVAASKVIFTE